VLLIGIAASSSFQTKRDVVLRPGESAVVDGRTITYVKPTVASDPAKFTFGSVVRVEEDGKVIATLRPSRRYFKPTGVTTSEISAYFDGEATSEVGLKAGATNDLWIAEQPDVSGVQGRVVKADQAFGDCVRGEPGTPPQCEALSALMLQARDNPALLPAAAAQIAELQAITADQIAQTYLTDDAPATFRVIVDPLVTWMWIGGLIALAGAIIGLWPTRGRRRGAVVQTEADARKETKYREIRDAELDHATGKLSDEDFALVDAELRREAVEILEQVEAKTVAARNGAASGNGADGHAEGEATANGSGETREKVEQG
jgi:cytochrome c-type biogenesis protein CcmF